MEDILASIRRILADDDAAASTAPSGTASVSRPSSPLNPTAAAPDSASAAPTTDRHGSEPHPASASGSKDQGAHLDFADIGSDSDAARDLPGDETEAPGRREEEGRAPPPGDEGGEDEGMVLELTPAMRLGPILSPPAAGAATDILAELARAILDRRDLDVGARAVTVEGMVREMLRPLLKEWLDRNLPYLVERLVKREIDLMINRAERLEE